MSRDKAPKAMRSVWFESLAVEIRVPPELCDECLREAGRLCRRRDSGFPALYVYCIHALCGGLLTFAPTGDRWELWRGAPVEIFYEDLHRLTRSASRHPPAEKLH